MAKAQKLSIWDPALVRAGVVDAIRKLDPRVVVRNPVMFVVEVGAAFTTVLLGRHVLAGTHTGFELQIVLWLWATVLFANLAEAMAEGRGKAQADTLRQARSQTMATRIGDGVEALVPAGELRRGDLVRVSAGEIIPADGEIIEGVASVDDSPVARRSCRIRSSSACRPTRATRSSTA